MKKRFKFVMVVGLIFVLIGALVTGAAYKYGMEHYVIELETYAQNFDVDSVNYIQINGVTASVYIEKGERFSVVAENFPKGILSCETVNNSLVITMNENNIFNLGFLQLPNFPSAKDPIFRAMKSGWLNSAKIYIYIPEGKRFNEISMIGNVGNIKADYIEGDKLYFYSNVGNITTNGFLTEYLDVTGGVGNVTLTGSANGNMHVNGGVGNITLNLEGNTDDYNISVNPGVGSVHINGEKHTYFDENYSKATAGAKYDINIDAGVGNVKLNIK